ncbi:hypothetical protein CXB49_12485 [Chromobacterium sp. ATCC 53434]|uniref:putative 2OG-Fe(II) oxygenase n=1 Tax=Chromobacterium TaxID=535 RepID=UPI000C778AEE|nr:putative 2OG-Fe(II) oxygenase [Chromobacterium sp. ATCC 53434]AUH51578.1 hypothetical protein CXB49_12485 [Chromobacterium sp. ATCC 53434]
MPTSPQITEQDPIRYWSELGQRHALASRYDDAIAAFENVLRLAGDHVLAQAWMAALRHASGDPSADYRPAEMIVESRPAGADLLRRLSAWVVERADLVPDPVDKATHGGRQSGELSMDDGPLAAELQQLLAAEVCRILELPDPGVASLAAQGLRISAWSVVLDSGGYQDIHIHQAGVLSGVFYLRIPAMSGSEHAGCLLFPHTVPWLPPRSGVQPPPPWPVRPESGLLLLFPSYLWHRTEPFRSDEPRICIAFDVLPGAPARHADQ